MLGQLVIDILGVEAVPGAAVVVFGFLITDKDVERFLVLGSGKDAPLNLRDLCRIRRLFCNTLRKRFKADDAEVCILRRKCRTQKIEINKRCPENKEIIGENIGRRLAFKHNYRLIELRIALLCVKAHVAVVKDKARYWLTSGEVAALNVANEPFKKQTDEEVLLWEALDWEAPMEEWTKKTSRQLSELLGLGGRRLVMIGKALNRIAGIDERVETPTNNHDRSYLTPPMKSMD